MSNSLGAGISMCAWKKLSKDEVLEILSPYRDNLAECIYGPWHRWTSEISKEFPHVTERGFANIMYEKITETAETLFASYPDSQVFLSKEHQSLKLTIDQRLLVRFKKLRPDKKTSNYPTRQSLLFDNQTYLDDYGDIDRINIGYLPDRFRTSIEAFITYPIGTALAWDEVLRPAATLKLQPSNQPETVFLPFRPKEKDKENETGNNS